MGFLALFSGIGSKPITFLEHEGRGMAERAKGLLESNGLSVSMIDEVPMDGKMYYVIGVWEYEKAKRILKRADIL